MLDFNLNKSFEKISITWYVQKVSRILNFRGFRILDFQFFVALCWYSYTSFMPTCSSILNVLLIFDSYFAWMCFDSSSNLPLLSDLGNTVITATLLCCFWPKIRAQTMMGEQGRYHGAKHNFCSSTNPGVSGELLRPNCADLAGNIHYWPFHPENLIQILWSIFWNSQKSKTSRNTYKQNSCQKLTEHSKWPNLSA